MALERRAGYVSVVAIDALAPLVPLLCFDRKRRDRPRLETPERDRLAGFLAIAVSAVVDACERGVDLGDQLALTIARPQFDRTIGLRGGPIREIGVILIFVLEVLKGLAALPQDVFFPGQKLCTEIIR